jgi:3-hydroxyisobutyrate dehydrogenase-like beta-hydroxyacid dehydrogenase
MREGVSLIGFGEAGQAFAIGGDWGTAARAYDRLTDQAATRAAKLADYEAAGVTGLSGTAEVVASAELILSVVTADQALTAARAAASHVAAGALYCDMNSVAPQTKRAAAAAIEDAGGHYVDIAVMAPVHPAGLSVPLMLSGTRAADAAERLRALGFSRLEIIGDQVGAASTVKMVRSVMVKGMEALSAECLIAAELAGVRDAVLASLDASPSRQPWAARADYDLDRMLVHGQRRAAEMEEAVHTLEGLGVEPAMTRATVAVQRAIGVRGLAPAPDGLARKLELLIERGAAA